MEVGRFFETRAVFQRDSGQKSSLDNEREGLGKEDTETLMNLSGRSGKEVS
jgi:hypothetical protein